MSRIGKGSAGMEKNILITGGSGDLGMGLVRALCGEADCLMVQGTGEMSELRAFAQQHPNVHPLECDLTQPEQLGKLTAQIAGLASPNHFVHLPALRVVNTRFRSFDEERFEKDFSIQVRSAAHLCRAFVPGMAKAGYGRVLFVLTSYLLGMPPKNVAGYVMAKSALQGLARSLAADYASNGVTVNCVAPSMIETSFLRDTSNLIIEASAGANPMGRNARVEDVVPAICFLLSEQARFITGVTLPITGGAEL